MNKRKAAVIRRKSLIDIKGKNDIIVVRSVCEISAKEYENEIKRIEESLSKIRKLQYPSKQTSLELNFKKNKSVSRKMIPLFEINEFMKKEK